MADGKERLAKEIGNLYLSDKASDIKITVGDVILFAHSVILIARCPAFELLLHENKSGEIVLRDTPLEAFRLVLKWIYTGTIELMDFDSDIEILRLAHIYELTDLKELDIEHLKSISTIDTMSRLLNEAIILDLTELTQYVIEHWKQNPSELLKHSTFPLLTTVALDRILKDAVSVLSSIEILEAFVRWMQANTDKREDFPGLLKNISINGITVGEMNLTVPSDLIDGTVIMNAAKENLWEVAKTNGLVNTNIATLKYGLNVVAGGETAFFSNSGAGKLLRHTLGSSNDGIVVDLGHCFKLNAFLMQLVETDNRTYSYWIDVSEDNVNWIRVIDHSNYTCRSLQKLNFEPRLVHYIRIFGTAPSDGALEISRFEAFFKSEPFEAVAENAVLIAENVVPPEEIANVVETAPNSEIETVDTST